MSTGQCRCPLAKTTIYIFIPLANTVMMMMTMVMMMMMMMMMLEL